MKRNKLIPKTSFVMLAAAILIIVFLYSTCTLFLGSESDDSPRGIFETVWNDFNKTYSLFAHKSINWNIIYDDFSPKVHNNMTDAELFEVIFNMLSTLDDTHIYFQSQTTGGNTGSSTWDNNTNYGSVFKVEFTNDAFDDFTIYDKYVNFEVIYSWDDWRIPTAITQTGISWGRFKDYPDIGYIYIPTFSDAEGVFLATGEWAKTIDNIIQNLADTRALVLDIRGNNGGYPSNQYYLQSRFASAKRDYMTMQTKNGPGSNNFSTSLISTIEPAGTTYTKPIKLLVNNNTVSAAEWFTIALRTQDHITVVGSNTNGALSTRVLRPLINGWDYTMSVQIVRCVQHGECYEARREDPNDRSSTLIRGITPDHLAPASTWAEMSSGIDLQLDEALRLLNP